MKSITKIISFLFFLKILFCFYSCNKCETCQDALTNEESSFICYKYNGGDLAYFKNNVSGALDTLKAILLGSGTFVGCYGKQGCKNYLDGMALQVNTHFGWWYINVSHNSPPTINFDNSKYSTLDMPTQTFTLNNIEYNDIFSVVVNPNGSNITYWKYYYSRSKGFVAFFMNDGSMWFKQ